MFPVSNVQMLHPYSNWSTSICHAKYPKMWIIYRRMR